MFIVMQQVLLLILFALVGYTLCKMGKVKSEHTKLLSTLHVYVFLPCSVLNTYAANFTPTYIREKYPNIKFLNREEDMGLEGLRKAKQSYYPHHMVEKCWARLMEDSDED